MIMLGIIPWVYKQRMYTLEEFKVEEFKVT